MEICETIGSGYIGRLKMWRIDICGGRIERMADRFDGRKKDGSFVVPNINDDEIFVIGDYWHVWWDHVAIQKWMNSWCTRLTLEYETLFGIWVDTTPEKQSQHCNRFKNIVIVMASVDVLYCSNIMAWHNQPVVTPLHVLHMV